MDFIENPKFIKLNCYSSFNGKHTGNMRSFFFWCHANIAKVFWLCIICRGPNKSHMKYCKLPGWHSQVQYKASASQSCVRVKAAHFIIRNRYKYNMIEKYFDSKILRYILIVSFTCYRQKPEVEYIYISSTNKFWKRDPSEARNSQRI